MEEWGTIITTITTILPFPTQRVPHTLPLWNYVPKSKIGMVFWGPNSIGSVYGPSGLVTKGRKPVQVLSAAGLEMASAVEWTDKPSAILLYAVMAPVRSLGLGFRGLGFRV